MNRRQNPNRRVNIVSLSVLAGVAVLACAGLLTGALTGNDPDTAVSPDPTRLDDAASLACEDMARGYAGATTRADRVDLAVQVNKWAKTSATPLIADMGKALTRSADGPDSAWKLAADGFAQACLTAGFKG